MNNNKPIKDMENKHCYFPPSIEESELTVESMILALSDTKEGDIENYNYDDHGIV
jgi:hypothetical protein